MSLAPASSRGFFLKARLAVNGIQCAARSFGTLTAAGRGLLSSMGASSSFVAFWGVAALAQAISSLAIRKRRDVRYLHSIGRFEGAQGDIQHIDEAGGLVGEVRIAIELLAEGFDHPGSKTSPGRRVNRRAVLFGPVQMAPL